MAHMRTCLEIGAKAAAEKKRFTLAIIYDELCRREWNQKATRGNYICEHHAPQHAAPMLSVCKVTLASM